MALFMNPEKRSSTSTELEPMVFEGELLPPEENAVVGHRITASKTLAKTVASGAATAGRTVRTVATHHRTKTTAKAIVRHCCFPVTGAGVVMKRWRDTHGASRYARLMRQAEIAGDSQMLLEWEARHVTEKQRRHQRIMRWVGSPVVVAKSIVISIISLAGSLLVLGMILAIADNDISLVLKPIIGIINFISWCILFLAAYGPLLLVGATICGIFHLWNTGRTTSEPLIHWATPTDPSQVRNVVPDEGAIFNALRNLGVAALNKKIKEGWQPRWVLATGRDGKGWRTQLELPPGVNVEMINDRKAVLAHNLVRLPIEVWPTEPKDQPGVLDLWVADQGILSGPVTPWPLLHEGTCDYFKGIPCAINVRGEQVIGHLMARNYLIAGIMGSGKSSLVICLLLGAMLDPLVTIDVHVLAYNVDYDPMRPRLNSLVKGDEPEHIQAAMDTLRALADEVSRRGRILEELGGEEAKVTRELANRDERLRPRVVVFDEVHELFNDKQYGAEAKELALKVTKKARKTAITLLWVTPDADASSLPRGIAKTASNRVAFAINDHQGNDAILGTGMHKRGYTATSLVAGEDIGTAMAAGFAKTPGLLRSHYIRKEKGIDEITPVVQRALAIREEAGVVDAPAQIPAPQVDPLADIAAVLGNSPRMRTQEVLQRLTEKDRTTYQSWTPQRLTEFLTPLGAAPYKSGGTMQVSRDRICEALTERYEESDHIDTDFEIDKVGSGD